MKHHLRAVCKLALCCVWLWPGFATAGQEPATDGGTQKQGGGRISQAGMQKPCFEEREEETSEQREQKALADLGDHYRAWLTEDVVYVITPAERCSFLHLETSDERDQFIEQFWLRRSSNPESLDNDFKDEHYRRVLFANEKFSANIAGWNTDRGHTYILFGPPDTIESHASGEPTGRPPEEGPETDQFPWERWHYRYLEGFGADVDLDFVDPAGSGNYRLALDAEEKGVLFPPPWGLVFDHPGLGEAKRLNSGRPVGSSTTSGEGQQITIYTGPVRFPQIKFKDLEAIVTAGIIRDQVYFSPEVQYLKATHASTVARIVVDVPGDELGTSKGSDKSTKEYEIFVRVSKVSGWVVETIERSGQAGREFEPNRHDPNRVALVPLEPGAYSLAIVVKDVDSGRVGVSYIPLSVPRYEELDTEKD